MSRVGPVLIRAALFLSGAVVGCAGTSLTIASETGVATEEPAEPSDAAVAADASDQELAGRGKPGD